MSSLSQIAADELMGRLSHEQAEQSRAVAEPEPPKISYLLWSLQHTAWWKPNAQGYTGDRREAGRYTQAEAVEHVVNSAMCGVLSNVTCMVAAPDNWVRS